MYTVSIEMVGVVMLSMVFTCAGFVMETNCMAPPPCRCTYTNIGCTTCHFTAIPYFKPTTAHIDKLTIQFQANDLTILPANAFRNINTTRATTISIYFQSNKLYHMDIDAFAGIEDAVVELHLADNRFTSVPAASTRLTKLKRLQMQANPITTIADFVMSQMSPTLEEFYVTAENLTAWPYAINHLRHLNYLDIYDIPFYHLPLDAFFGLGSSLVELRVSGNLRSGVPSAVCFLRNLKQLDANGIKFQTPERILVLQETCEHTLSKVDPFMHIST